MITKAYNRIKDGIVWVKNNPKKALLAVLGVGVVGAAPLLRDPKIDINTYQIAPITFQNKQISFPCTDGQDHTGETVAIRTDDCDIVSWGGDSDNIYTYVAVSNLSQDDQNFQLQGFHSNGSEFVKFEEMKLQVPYQREVDDYSDVTYECAEGWEKTKEISPIPTYSCTSLKETKACKTVDKTTCTVSEKSGSHSGTYYVDELGSIIKNPSPDTALDLASKKREDAKMVLKDQIEYWIPSGETRYFRAKLKFPKGKDLSGKFSVKVFGSMGAIGSIDPSWYSASWGYRRQITLDYTKVGTTTPVTGFPLMFSTSTIADLKFTGSGGKVGKSDGTDILVTESDGTTKIPHELEFYSSSTGETVLHFKSNTSTALSTSTNTSYYIYYGNSGASDQQDTANVWDSNYKGVYHLKNGITLTGSDSTSNANNGTLTNTPTATTTGQIDGAANFVGGSSQYITGTGINIASTTLTISFWVKMVSGGADQTIFSIGSTGATRQAIHLRRTTDTAMTFGMWFDDLSSGVPNLTSWRHITVTLDSSFNQRLYADGVLQNSRTAGGYFTGNTTWNIGRFQSFGEYISGNVDEVRVSAVNRSASWIKTEYNNQSSPNTFWSVAAEETAPSTGDAPGTVYLKGDLRTTGDIRIK